MRCYGDKKPSFTAKVPSGMLPVMEIDGAMITDSAAIAAALESTFPETPLLPADGTPERARASELLKLERALFSRWMGWLTSGWADGQNRSGFEEALDLVDAELRATPGPYFLGESFSLVDITYTPFLERMAASLAYYKGFRMEGGGRWAGLDAWYAAMASRPAYAGVKSDYYTHCHDLPPQLGGCEANGDEEQMAMRAAIDGEGDAWRLPLAPLSAASSPEPSWTGEDAELDRLEAASAVVRNKEAVVRFAARARNARDALDLAGKLPLALKANAIGIPANELNIDPAQAGGLLGKFDALVGRGGAEIKGARSCRGEQTFQFSRLRAGTPFEHLILVARSQNPTDWTDLCQLDRLFWLGYVSRAAFDRALAERRQARLQAQRRAVQQDASDEEDGPTETARATYAPAVVSRGQGDAHRRGVLRAPSSRSASTAGCRRSPRGRRRRTSPPEERARRAARASPTARTTPTRSPRRARG